ncbi:hypothetical protein SAMN04487886_12118 [Clostridium sp. DSM 8431]|uniref:hypothetical protein n=1 Tax=Clostridium sp. DSM 8431 TaxID=1761781 RepID=UPI0008F1A0C9|nr:hypothetical protein [Clostridium sp. DSM 8431]SFU84025.1 hypothetical protein SAMN04487886_12118 [Clostridium sp. DSM 8431]
MTGCTEKEEASIAMTKTYIESQKDLNSAERKVNEALLNYPESIELNTLKEENELYNNAKHKYYEENLEEAKENIERIQYFSL